METTITINFRGLCTQMIADNDWTPGAFPLDLRADGRKVAIRVFLANSALIASQIDPSVNVPHHHPGIRFEDAMMSDEIRRAFRTSARSRSRGEVVQASLGRTGIELDGAARTDAVIEPSFKKLPSVLTLTPSHPSGLVTRPEALDGFANHAHVYFDLSPASASPGSATPTRSPRR